MEQSFKAVFTNQDKRASVGRSLYKTKKEYDWAIEAYNTVLALNPNNAEAHKYRALAYNRTCEFDHTHEAFTKVAHKNTKTG